MSTSATDLYVELLGDPSPACETVTPPREGERLTAHCTIRDWFSERLDKFASCTIHGPYVDFKAATDFLKTWHSPRVTFGEISGRRVAK